MPSAPASASAVRSTNRPLTVAALLLSMFMAAMEATVVATAMPTVISDLGGIHLYGWVGAAYLLASTVTVPLYGKLADRAGRKPILQLGIALFFVGSLASGLSPSIEGLIAARAIQGLGAGALQPIVLTVIGDLYTPAERGRIQGFFGAVWGLAGVSGPMLGGAIVALASWRWVFWVNLPFAVASALALAIAYHEVPRRVETRPLDWAGAGAILLGSVALLLATSGVVPIPMLASAVAFGALFVFIERRAVDPVLPIPLLRRPLIAVGAGASFMLGLSMMAVLNYLPLHVQGVLSGMPTEAGLVITPMLVGWPMASAATSRFIVRTGYRKPVLLGAALTVLGLATLAPLVAMRAPASWLGASMFVFGLGMGLSSTAIIIGVQSSVGWEERGVVTATTMFARTIGGALGVGMLGALLAARLARSLAPETVRAILDPHGRGAAIVAPGVIDALGHALAPLFWVGTAAAVCGLLIALFHPQDRRTDEKEQATTVHADR